VVFQNLISKISKISGVLVTATRDTKDPFKLDTTGRGGLTLIEVNGRFGQPPLSIAPGVGFPYLPCMMATEGDVDQVFGDCARVGCRPVRTILRDLLLSVASLRDGGGGSGVLIGFLRSGGMGCDVLSKRDLLPAVGAMRVMAHRMGAVVSGKRNVSGEVR